MDSSSGLWTRLSRNGKHDYRAGRLETAHQEKARDPLVLYTLLNIRHIAQVNRRAVRVPCHDQFAIALGLIDLPIGLQHKGTMRTVELPRARIDRARFNPAG